MSISVIAAGGIITFLLALMIKPYRPDFSAIITISGTIILFLASVSYVTPIITRIISISEKYNINSTFKILLKSIGVCIITKLSADVCTDGGSNSIASKIEFAGKVIVLTFVLPLFEQLLEITTEILNL